MYKFCILILLIFLYLIPCRVIAQFKNPSNQPQNNSTKNISELLNLSKKAEESGDRRSASDYLNQAAFIEWEKKNYQQAITYFEKSIQLNEGLGNDNGVMMINNNLGMLYDDLGNFEKALFYFKQTLEGRRAANNREGIVSGLVNLSVVSNNLKKYRESISYLNEALDLAREKNDIIQMRSCYGMLAETYEKSGDTKNALYYFEFYRSFHEMIQKDKEKNLRNEAENIELRNRLLEFEKKNQELALLSKDKILDEKETQLQQVDLSNQELLSKASKQDLIIAYLKKEAEVKEKDAEIKNLKLKEHEVMLEKNNNYFTLLILIISLLLLISAILFGNYLNKRRINKQLEQKNDEILVQSEKLKEANEEVNAINTHLEEIVSQRTAALRKTNKELDTFLYRASHDLRRPITTLKGLVEVSNFSTKDPNAHVLFKHVNLTADNMDKMLLKLMNISEMSKLENGNQEISFQKLLKELEKWFKPLLEEYNVEFKYKIQVRDKISLNLYLIQVILSNLIENAIYFSSQSKDAFVELTIQEKENYLFISVKDNGLGIEQKYIKKVFGLYFRANEKSHGNGLGLYVVKKAVDKLGGEIKIESSLDDYTLIGVNIPKNKKSHKA